MIAARQRCAIAQPTAKPAISDDKCLYDMHVLTCVRKDKHPHSVLLTHSRNAIAALKHKHDRAASFPRTVMTAAAELGIEPNGTGQEALAELANLRVRSSPGASGTTHSDAANATGVDAGGDTSMADAQGGADASNVSATTAEIIAQIATVGKPGAADATPTLDKTYAGAVAGGDPADQDVDSAVAAIRTAAATLDNLDSKAKANGQKGALYTVLSLRLRMASNLLGSLIGCLDTARNDAEATSDEHVEALRTIQRLTERIETLENEKAALGASVKDLECQANVSSSLMLNKHATRAMNAAIYALVSLVVGQQAAAKIDLTGLADQPASDVCAVLDAVERVGGFNVAECADAIVNALQSGIIEVRMGTRNNPNPQHNPNPNPNPDNQNPGGAGPDGQHHQHNSGGHPHPNGDGGEDPSGSQGGGGGRLQRRR